MALIPAESMNRIIAGQPQAAEPLDTNFRAIWDAINGNLDGSNLADGAVYGDIIAPLGVGKGKLAVNAVELVNIDASAKNLAPATPSLRKLGVTENDAANGQALVAVTTMQSNDVTSGYINDGIYGRSGNGTYPLTLTLPAMPVAGIWFITGFCRFGYSTYSTTTGSLILVGVRVVTGNTDLGSSIGYCMDRLSSTDNPSTYQMPSAVLQVNAGEEKKIGLVTTLDGGNVVKFTLTSYAGNRLSAHFVPLAP